MKPVTIETVRERLSYLEGLNERGVGTAVSQQQFETACLRELLTLLDEQEAAEKRIAEHNFESRLLANADRDIKALRQRIAELEARTYIPQPLDIEDECQSYEYVAGWNDCRDAASVRQQTPAVCDVIAERFRQQSVEGWTLEHDDQYGKSQLLWASSCYLLNTIQPFNRIPMDWPWDSSWWKPTNPRRDLVKACALIIAEIERRDRAAGIKVKG